MIVTPLYMALAAVMLIALSVNVIRNRYREQVALLDGGREPLTRAIRAQNNFVEYVPMILLLMTAGELMQGSHLLLHLAGIAMLIGRISHAYSLLSAEPKRNTLRFRMGGMILTFTVLGVLALWVVFMVLQVYLYVDTAGV